MSKCVAFSVGSYYISLIFTTPLVKIYISYIFYATAREIYYDLTLNSSNILYI